MDAVEAMGIALEQASLAVAHDDVGSNPTHSATSPRDRITYYVSRPEAYRRPLRDFVIRCTQYVIRPGGAGPRGGSGI